MKLGSIDALKAYIGSVPVLKMVLNGNQLCFNTVDYTERYLTFEIVTNGMINIKTNGNIGAKTIQYSVNNGEWQKLTTNKKNGKIVYLGPFKYKDKIRFKGLNNCYAISGYDNFINFESLDAKGKLIPESATYNISGNIMSLIYGDNFEIQTRLPECGYNFYSLFKYAGCIDTSNLILPATILTSYCYQNMFEGCAMLKKMPVLPSLILATGCYSGMFQGCKSLIETTPLNATELTPYCYQLMFNKCSNLNHINCYAINMSADYCVDRWVGDVSKLGNFIKNSNAEWKSGNSGIPKDWMVEDTIL